MKVRFSLLLHFYLCSVNSFISASTANPKIRIVHRICICIGIFPILHFVFVNLLRSSADDEEPSEVDPGQTTGLKHPTGLGSSFLHKTSRSPFILWPFDHINIFSDHLQLFAKKEGSDKTSSLFPHTTSWSPFILWRYWYCFWSYWYCWLIVVHYNSLQNKSDKSDMV